MIDKGMIELVDEKHFEGLADMLEGNGIMWTS